MNKNAKVSWSVLAGFLALMLMSVSLSMSGCELTDSRNATTGPTPKAQMTNTELEDMIKAKFNANPQLKAANLSVDGNAERNEVTLSGTVETESLRTKAVELAKSAHEGLIITTKIDVKPAEILRTAYTKEEAREERSKAKERGETVGDSLDDAWIHTKIVTQLIGNSKTSERNINVDVTNNAVTLRGTVGTAEERTEAGRVAKNTEGVKTVSNQLKVSGAPMKKS